MIFYFWLSKNSVLLKLSSFHKGLIIIISILIADQALKLWVKSTMYLNETYHIFDGWFLLSFVENDGMAFGMDIPVSFGKIALSIFRIIAVIVIGWYLYKQTRKKVSIGFVVCIAMVLAGAMGNIFDCAFYGLLFGHSGFSPSEVAVFMPEEGGYASFLHGSVVDMFRFKVTGYWPDWFPFGLGGKYFDLFPPVFNIADSSITIGIALLLIFQRRFFRKEEAGSGTSH